MTKRRPPYQHSDGSGCWTKECSFRLKENTETVSYEEFFSTTSTQPETTHSTPSEVAETLKNKYGATIRFSKEGEGYAVVDYIIIPKENRNKGVGTKVMEELTRTADSNKWDLALTPSDVFGSSEKRLEIFYRRFGFVRNGSGNKKQLAQETMIRYAA